MDWLRRKMFQPTDHKQHTDDLPPRFEQYHLPYALAEEGLEQVVTSHISMLIDCPPYREQFQRAYTTLSTHSNAWLGPSIREFILTVARSEVDPNLPHDWRYGQHRGHPRLGAWQCSAIRRLSPSQRQALENTVAQMICRGYAMHLIYEVLVERQLAISPDMPTSTYLEYVSRVAGSSLALSRLSRQGTAWPVVLQLSRALSTMIMLERFSQLSGLSIGKQRGTYKPIADLAHFYHDDLGLELREMEAVFAFSTGDLERLQDYLFLSR